MRLLLLLPAVPAAAHGNLIDVTPGAFYFSAALALLAYVSSDILILRRLFKVSWRTAAAACLAADAAAGAVALAAFVAGEALLGAVTRLANLAAGNPQAGSFLDDSGFAAGCAASFLVLRAAGLPFLLGRLRRVVALDALPEEPLLGRCGKLGAWSLLSAAATAAAAGAAYVLMFALSVVAALLS